MEVARGRWDGVRRDYGPEDVAKLKGSVRIEHTLATLGAHRLWHLLQNRDYLGALGAMTGNQAVQQVEAGLEAIYLSGWQVAADANTAGHMYPDQSLYPANSVPEITRRINQAFQRADQIQVSEGIPSSERKYWYAPIVVDAEAGFGGNLNAFELAKSLIEAGAAAIHLEDQLASAKKCGHLGGKVLVPTGEFLQKLCAVRLAADVLDVPTVLIARTDARSAELLTSDVDARDRDFLTGERTVEGFFRVKSGIEVAIARGLAYAPYADMLWFETSEPDLEEARRFSQEIRKQFPSKLLAYNCSPSFNWKKKLRLDEIARFQKELALLGYKFQFVTLAGFHSLNHGMFELAYDYRERGMSAYADFQDREFDSEKRGYRAAKHQRFVGAGYYDQVAQTIANGLLSTCSLKGSTEEEQFETPKPAAQSA
jgi:isocitrate lyase